MQGRYEFLAQDRIIYGFPAAQAVAETADAQGAQRVFLVTSQTLSRKTGEIRKIRDVLGPRCVGLFDECIAHVPRESVLRAADAVRREVRGELRGGMIRQEGEGPGAEVDVGVEKHGGGLRA